MSDGSARPTRVFSKPVIDPLNTAAWFLMDAFWLAKLTWPAFAAAGLTVVTGLLLLALGRREDRGTLFADMGLLCWIAMNTVWCVSDLSGRETPREFAAVMGVLGAALIAAAAWHSQDLRRVRIVRR